MEKQWKLSDFILGGAKITADGDCSHEIKRRLLLGRKVMTNVGSILKSKDITLPTKVHLVKVLVCPVVTYGCESWTIKKGECQRTDASELWCWRRLLRVPWTARRSNQSILKEISPECSLEWLILKLKLQYFGHLMWRADSFERPWCWERLRAEGEGDDRRWDGWMASPTQWTWVWVDSGSWWWTGRPGVLWFMVLQRVRHDWETELNWTECSTFTEGEGDDRRWDDWMASPTQWTWVSVNPGSWWWTGRPGMLQSMGLQRVGHDWTSELNRVKENVIW